MGISISFAWKGSYYLIGLLIIIPLLWYIENFIESIVFIFFYYLFSTKSIPVIMSEYNYFYSIMPNFKIFYYSIWFVYSIILSIPWILAKKIQYKYQDFWQLRLLIIIFPLLIGIVPPFYILGLGSPIEGAGFYFPKLGFLGIFLYLSLIILLCSLFDLKFYKNYQNYLNNHKINKLFFLLILIIISICSNFFYKNKEIKDDWISVSTNIRPFQYNSYVFEYLKSIILFLIDKNYKIIVLPENALGIWDKKNINKWKSIIEYAKKNKSTVISGAYFLTDNNKIESGIIGFGKTNKVLYHIRQPIPIAGWNPFSKNGLSVDWISRGSRIINGEKIAFVVCYEELLPGVILSSFIDFYPPNYIISVANNWVGKGTGEAHAQFNSLFIMSRLFGVPFLRSWNR